MIGGEVVLYRKGNGREAGQEIEWCEWDVKIITGISYNKKRKFDYRYLRIKVILKI